MIMILYMNIKDLFGSRATAIIFRRSTSWGVNDAGDMVGVFGWCQSGERFSCVNHIINSLRYGVRKDDRT
jgi:hypothetical protein